jgi:hypothetical protein
LGTLARWSLLGVAVLALAVLWDVQRTGGNPVGLLQPGLRGPSAAAVAADFPDVVLPDHTGHDGQQFYAVARRPMHLDEVAGDLDRPRYRLQRPLLPWLAWALHPSGGGPGLVAAMLAVNLAAVFVGGIALGRLTGRAWTAALFAVLPGTYAAVRISTADALAVALALAAVAVLGSGRRWAAALLAVGAVLAKEPTILVFAGVALWRRDRDGWLLLGAPLAAAGAWWAWLHVAVAENGAGVVEFGLPFAGMVTSASRWWLHGQEGWAVAGLVLAVGLAVAALVRGGLGSPAAAVVAVHLPFVAVLGPDVIGLNLNATRATLPLVAFSIVALYGASRTVAIRQPNPALSSTATTS